MPCRQHLEPRSFAAVPIAAKKTRRVGNPAVMRESPGLTENSNNQCGCTRSDGYRPNSTTNHQSPQMAACAANNEKNAVLSEIRLGRCNDASTLLL